MATAKKQRNYAVDFWRMFATLAVCWGHMGSVGFRFTSGGVNYPSSTLLTEGPVLGVFLVFTGYFMMKSFEGKKLRGLNDGKSASSLALTYLKTRYLGLWPALFIGTLFGYLMCMAGSLTGLWHGKLLTVGEDFNGIKDIIASLNSTILQWFGLDSTGILADTGYSFSWNAPMWYISAIFVAGYLFYYLLCKNEDLTRGLIVPLVVIICPCMWAMSDLSMNDRGYGALAFGMFDNALVFGSWGTALGIFLYRPYEALRKMKIGEKGKRWLTVIHVILAAWLVYICIAGLDGLYITSDEIRINSEMYVDLVVAVTMIFAVANQDYLTQKVFNHKIFGTLGEFSLYFFIVHIHVINLVCGLVGGENVTTSWQYYLCLLAVIILSCILGFICQVICKKGIQPLLYKLDNAIQTCTRNGQIERGEIPAVEAAPAAAQAAATKAK
ncbi:MAG: acyltransferase family protein [Lachnospiraceae bacterium]|nr:acyltransferase family protein [Lachnospiraceae bacterium]